MNIGEALSEIELIKTKTTVSPKLLVLSHSALIDSIDDCVKQLFVSEGILVQKIFFDW